MTERESSHLSQAPFERGASELLPTPDLQAAYAAISAETLPRAPAIEHKKALVSEIRTRGHLSEEILRRYPVVYVGSATDVEYPLALGCRNLVLVDPALREPEARDSLVRRISKVIGEQPTQRSERELDFAFDFGAGDEQVRVRLEPTLYHPSSEEAAQRWGRFAPPKEIGMILGYQTEGVQVDEEHAAMERLVPGGYVLTNSASGSFLTTLSEEERAQYIYRDHPKPVIELLQKKWAERGFEFVALHTEGDSYHYTFLRKQS